MSIVPWLLWSRYTLSAWGVHQVRILCWGCGRGGAVPMSNLKVCLAPIRSVCSGLGVWPISSDRNEDPCFISIFSSKTFFWSNSQCFFSFHNPPFSHKKQSFINFLWRVFTGFNKDLTIINFTYNMNVFFFHTSQRFAIILTRELQVMCFFHTESLCTWPPHLSLFFASRPHHQHHHLPFQAHSALLRKLSF